MPVNVLGRHGRGHWVVETKVTFCFKTGGAGLPLNDLGPIFRACSCGPGSGIQSHVGAPLPRPYSVCTERPRLLLPPGASSRHCTRAGKDSLGETLKAMRGVAAPHVTSPESLGAAWLSGLLRGC